VQALPMGRQACILYGAAEVSRDVAAAVLASVKNLERLRAALAGGGLGAARLLYQTTEPRP
jgi:hypothetical protein